MSVRNNSLAEHVRIIWTIAAKDIAGAVRSRNTLPVLISALFVVVLYRMLPSLSLAREPLPVLVYDAGTSALTVYLENSKAVTARTQYDTQESMLQALARGDVPELGLVIPKDFDRSLEARNVEPLRGYVSYWLSAREADEVRQAVETEIARLLGRTVPIELQAERAYLEPSPNGAGTQAAMALVFALGMVGITLVPYLMLEEKQSRTLEVLLVSPASEAQVILAKAVAGLFYCLLTAAVTLGINHSLIVHWGLTLLAVLCFSLFVVSLGLWLGTKIDTRAQLTMLAWPFYVLLFFPMIVYILGDLFPDIVSRLIVVVPPATMLVVMSHAFAGAITWGSPLLGLAWILGCTGLALAATVWLARRRDREAEGRLQIRELAVASRAPAGGLSQRRVGEVQLAHREQGALRRGQPGASTHSLSKATRPASGAQIMAALVAKDMREAINNRLLLSILLGTAFVVLNGAALPLLLQARMKPSAIVYDEGRSGILRGLAGGDEFGLRFAESRQEMETAIVEGWPGTGLGLVIPADFDARAGSGQVIELDGYIAHWTDPAKVSRIVAIFEAELGKALWGTVKINLEGHKLYPAASVGGQIGINLLTMLIAVTTLGITLVPLLLVEEKESHTLEALLVSPARFHQIVSAKAVVGGAYCLLAFAVVALFHLKWILHWDVLLLAILPTVALAVGLGLLVGILADNPTSAAFWGVPLLLLFMASMLAEFFVGSTAPAAVRDVITWLPGSLMMRLFAFASAGEFPAGQMWLKAGALAAMAAAAYLLVGWRLRQWDR